MKQTNKAILYACIAVLSWSTVATAFKKSLEHISHFELVLVSCVTSLLIFAILMTIQKKWSLLKGLTGKEWGYFALLGLLNPVAYYLVLFKSYDLLPAQVAQPINYAWPIVLVVLLAIFTKQPIQPKKYIGMAISLGGVAMISLGGGQALGAKLPLSGLLLAALSAFLWASYWVVNNKNKERFDASLAFFMTFLFGSIYMTIGSFFVGVDLNTASPSLLKYVAGITAATAKNIVAYREENGVFTDRKQFKKVSKLGDKAFLQCALIFILKFVIYYYILTFLNMVENIVVLKAIGMESI